MATKYIFCTGGVVSSLGKGVTAASIGRLLKSRGLSVSVQKLDPYLNVDPGTMSPYEHGEVFVLEDGSETDLDLGTYERYIDEDLTSVNNVTTGQVYQAIIARERRGDFLGKTIQVVPHVTNELKECITRVAKVSGAEVVLVEVGGTVGDIEGLPFIEALRQMRMDYGRDNTLFIHLTLLPHIGATGELKTKPTQHSVRELLSQGIQPDAIVCRADYPIDDALRDKIALFCNVEEKAVVGLTTAENIYELPIIMEEAGLGDFIVRRLKLKTDKPDLGSWREMVTEMLLPKPVVKIGVVGKYVELRDAYISVKEAIMHAASSQGCTAELVWLSSDGLEKGEGLEHLDRIDGVVVPGGFGYRGIEGKLVAAEYARANNLPYLGLCLGMQVMVIELAREVFESDSPNSTEFDEDTSYPVIDLMPDQRYVTDMGGTMRLGSYPCRIMPGTRTEEAYGTELVFERHRHRFEFNNEYRHPLCKAGLVLSGISPNGKLVEIVELKDHPFMVGTQFHPEFKSRPNRPHPLFTALMKAAKEKAEHGA